MKINFRRSGEYVFIEVTNGLGQQTLFCSFGASVCRLVHKGYDYLFSPWREDDFLFSKGYYGKTLGPIAGRYDLSQFTSGHHQVVTHGGSQGLSFKNFVFSLKECPQYCEVVFTRKVEEKQYFVGNHAIYKVIYHVDEGEPGMIVFHEITALEDTYASLSLHNYYRLSSQGILSTRVRLSAEAVYFVNEKTFLIEGARPLAGQFLLDGTKPLGDLLFGADHYGKHGHYLSGVKGPIVAENELHRITLTSSYPDALFYLDSYPCGVQGFEKEKEKPFAALVIEPEIMPNKKSSLYLAKGTTRKNWIKVDIK